ncbi:MAG: DUF1343 domain-containing protein [Treponemataceae bacterium]
MKKYFINIKLNTSFFLIIIFLILTSCKTLSDTTEIEKKIETISPTPEASLVLGIERVDEFFEYFSNKRVGLITNATGINKDGKPSIDILYEKVNLVALFSPEHGIRGSETAGKNISHTIDKKTGLPVYSLYGNTKRPTKKMLKDIDILCFDIQDVGSRFYTYIWTLAYAMEACAEQGVDFVVFDRPNPIGNTVEGAILQLPYRSFVGYLPIAQRHGMTVGELASMFNTEFKINSSLKVIKMKNYFYNKKYSDYNLMWIPTSPNIPHQNTALVYSGMCLFEGVNLSVGRGTTMPFEYIGAPYINAEKFSASLNALKLEGAFFYPAYFTPTDSLYKGIPCEGVQIIIRDTEKIKPVTIAVYMFDILKKTYGKNFQVRNAKSKYAAVNLLSGTAYFTDPNFNTKEVLQKMQNDVERFIELRKPYMLYE